MTSTNILYVECEPALFTTVKVFLEKNGAFDVTVCKSGVEALKLLAVQHFDAIVSEFLMPEMSGIEFLSYIRQNGDDTPFIFFTRTCGEDAVIEALNNGADFYIKKNDNPVSQFSLLMEKIEFLISRKQKKTVFSETEPGIIFNGNPVPLALVSVPEAVFVAVNDMFLQSLGYTREEVIGKSTKELGIFADNTDIDRLRSELNNKQFVNGMELQLRLKSGEITICRFFSRIVVIGEKKYTLSTIVDITERKKTEKALKNEIIMRRILIDQSLDGIVTLDKSGKVFETNQSFADMLGYTTEEVRNMSVWD
ncbi:MAG: PAS domain S-box protein [Methanomicrobium sp.]|nr:PAS domain S-box protein [Methanomicrobium sp.]